jgi:hypothetical protein
MTTRAEPPSVPALPEGPIVKHCPCCGRAFTLVQWREQHLNGWQDDGLDRMEYRTCACGSTSVIFVDAAGEPTESREPPA